MRISYKRVAICYFLVALMMFVCVFRVFTVMKDETYAAAAESERKRTVTLNYSRGSIFDCNMQRITNSKSVYYAVIFNQPSALAVLYNYFTSEETKAIIDEIQKNGFALRTVSREIVCDGIYCVKANVHADDSLLAKHIVGYISSEGRGVTGLEAAFEYVLAGTQQNTLSFSINGIGQLIHGEEPVLNYDYGKENCGVKTTIDSEIQQIAEQEAMAIESGAIIITEVSTGKIRAMVSRPDYKISNLATALTDSNEPMLNRALCTYNIGSVFKPIVAAAGYENNISYETVCKGYTDIDGLTFTCHKLSGHGNMDVTSALKYSCNSFFYNFIQKTGADKVIELAKKAGFETSVQLANGLYCKAGSLGNKTIIKSSPRALANLSIGQGELMLSPLVITNCYMAIANDGSYRTPSLIEGIVENGKLIDEYPLPASVKLMSDSTASKLKNDLATVLTEGGTGEKANPALTTAAGKTGTAQTGILKDGKKVTNSWFCGFFPFDQPQYAVTILSQNASDGCASIFAAVADETTKLVQSRSD